MRPARDPLRSALEVVFCAPLAIVAELSRPPRCGVTGCVGCELAEKHWRLRRWIWGSVALGVAALARAVW